MLSYAQSDQARIKADIASAQTGTSFWTVIRKASLLLMATGADIHTGQLPTTCEDVGEKYTCMHIMAWTRLQLTAVCKHASQFMVQKSQRATAVDRLCWCQCMRTRLSAQALHLVMWDCSPAKWDCSRCHQSLQGIWWGRSRLSAWD